MKSTIDDTGAPRKLGSATSPKFEDLLDAWRDAREEAVWAYEAWCDGSIEERRMTYAVLVAAADREEAAEATFLRALRAEQLPVAGDCEPSRSGPGGS